MSPAPKESQPNQKTENQPDTAATKSGTGYMIYKIFREIGPLIIFFAAYKYEGLMFATAVFMVTMAITMVSSWIIDRHIPVMLWVTFGIVVVMGSLTLYLQDETFVKMKPTIINSIFATILAVGLMTGRPLIKVIMQSGLPDLREEGWHVMSRNWAVFFAVMAIFNEVIWRTQSTETWVDVKTFGYLPLTMVFAFSQVFTIQKYLPAEPSND